MAAPIPIAAEIVLKNRAPEVSWDEILTPARPFLEQVSRRLEAQVDGFEPEIAGQARYALDNRGKQLRPAFVVLCAGSVGSIAEDHVTIADGLERAGIALVGSSKGIDLGLAQRDGVTHHHPLHPFGTGRRGQTALILVGDMFGRQQGWPINGGTGCAAFGRAGPSDVRLPGCIGRITSDNHYADNRQHTCLGLMHKMHFCRCFHPVDGMLARRVKVELLECIHRLADGQYVAGCRHRLDRVSVIDEVRCTSAVPKDRVGDIVGRFGRDVDGGLRRPVDTQQIGGVEFAPVLWAFFAFVGPVCRSMRGGRIDCTIGSGLCSCPTGCHHNQNQSHPHHVFCTQNHLSYPLLLAVLCGHYRF